jgi:hypothetical protein
VSILDQMLGQVPLPASSPAPAGSVPVPAAGGPANSMAADVTLTGAQASYAHRFTSTWSAQAWAGATWSGNASAGFSLKGSW